MIQKKSTYIRFLLFAAISIFATSCMGPSAFTNKDTPWPVVLGPVKNIRARQPANLGPFVDTFDAQVEKVFFVAATTVQTGNFILTTGWMTAYGQSPTKFDYAAIEAKSTAACSECVLKAERVELGSYYFLGFGLAQDKNWIRVLGGVHGFE